jgi:serine kinase of HPr protein (carbohydrate metabolism regulator)
MKPDKGSVAKDTAMMGSTAGACNRRARIEFDIHGVLGIRLVDPSPSDVAAVSKQLGPLQRRLLREPDITLRFVRHLPTPRLQYLGVRQNGFTDDAFFVFGEGENNAKARIPFDQIGSSCEIVCESGVQSVPLLMPILSLTALAKGYVPLHASAFVYNSVGVLVAGWAGSGKTTTLLGFASREADFIGEDWVLLSGDGQKMCGLPRDIELSPSLLEIPPHVRRAIKPSKLWPFEGLRFLGGIQGILGGMRGRTFPGKALRRAITSIQHRVAPKVRPQEIFGGSVSSLIGKPDKVFLLISHEDPSVRVELTPPFEMARRLAHLGQQEQMRFNEHYLAFKFAFPKAKNAFIEQSHEYQVATLTDALAEKDTYTIWHPYPLPFSVIYETIRPFCEATEKAQTESLCSLL